jgi:hypothetical protein
LLRLAEADFESYNHTELHIQFERIFPSTDNLSAEERAELVSQARTVFSVVRNPYTRLLSGFADKVKRHSPRRAARLMALGLDPGKTIDLDLFLRAISNSDPGVLDTHWRPQALLVRPSLVPYTHILRFEDLDAQLHKMLRELCGFDGRVNSLVRRGNRTHAEAIDIEQLTASSKEMIKKIYGNDFEIFGYGM